MPVAEKDFFTKEIKEKAKAAIEHVEKHTSAELVVTVRRESGFYRYADYLLGFIVAFTTLGLLLFLPQEFAIEIMPLNVALGFVLGALLSVVLTPVRRVLARKKHMKEAVANAARAAFVDQGISRTTGRNGMLVYVSAFERRVEVVCDVGIRTAEFGDAWVEWAKRLDSAVNGMKVEPFLATLRELGPLLGPSMPRRADDINELADDVT